MTTYASFDYYEDHPRYLTPGKRYEVLLELEGNYFEIIDDEGDRVGCLWDNWTRHDEPKQTRYRIQVPGRTRHTEPKQTRYNIQVPGKTDIEHVIDYRMDGDMLYAAGADFENYYHMKPGDLVTITEMED